MEGIAILKMDKSYVAPEKPQYGQIAIPDGVHWDPLGMEVGHLSGGMARNGCHLAVEAMAERQGRLDHLVR